MKVVVASADVNAGQVDFQWVKDDKTAQLEEGEVEDGLDIFGESRPKKKNPNKMRQQDFPKKEKFDEKSSGGRRGNSRPQTKFGDRQPQNRKPRDESENNNAPKTYKETRLGFGKNKEQNTGKKSFGKSLKAQKLDSDTSKVFKFLNVPADAPPGERGNFDPESHFENAKKKWKSRQDAGGERPRFGDKDDSRDSDRSEQRSQRSDKPRSGSNDRGAQSNRSDKSERPQQGGKPAKPASRLFKKKFKNRKSR